jgi:hypothetical protein
MAGAGLGMLVFVPLGSLLGVFEIPRLGLRWEAAGPLYIWGTSLAVIASVGGPPSLAHACRERRHDPAVDRRSGRNSDCLRSESSSVRAAFSVNE